jgi:hypothetical protein
MRGCCVSKGKGTVRSRSRKGSSKSLVSLAQVHAFPLLRRVPWARAWAPSANRTWNNETRGLQVDGRARCAKGVGCKKARRRWVLCAVEWLCLSISTAIKAQNGLENEVLDSIHLSVSLGLRGHENPHVSFARSSSSQLKGISP